jgi:hypothetical protein
MPEKIQYDECGESQVFAIGDDRIFFRWDDETPESIQVLHAATGEPYSRTNEYIRFATKAEAQWFLEQAIIEGTLPHGWQ